MLPPFPLANGDERDSQRQFLTLCLRSRFDSSTLTEAQAIFVAADFDKEAAATLAAAERLGPLLYDALRHSDWLPADFQATLRRQFDIAALQNTFRLHTLAQALAALDDAGVRSIVLKGAALAENVYASAALRPMRDLDLLIHRTDLPGAVARLETLGYENLGADIVPGALLADASQQQLGLATAVPVVLELHWRLLDSPYYHDRLDVDWFWQSAVPGRVAGRPARFLGPEAHLLYLCAHLSLHHRGQGLLWLNDLAEVIVSTPNLDWQTLLERARADDLVLPLQQFLPLLIEEWRLPAPDGLLAQIVSLQPAPAELRLQRLLAGGSRSVAGRFWVDFLSLSGWSRRVRFLFDNLFPSPSYMRHRYHMAAPALLPLYYPYRWFLGLRSAIAGDRAR